jgi:hypothetical protein
VASEKPILETVTVTAPAPSPSPTYTGSTSAQVFAEAQSHRLRQRATKRKTAATAAAAALARIVENPLAGVQSAPGMTQFANQAAANAPSFLDEVVVTATRLSSKILGTVLNLIWPSPITPDPEFITRFKPSPKEMPTWNLPELPLPALPQPTMPTLPLEWSPTIYDLPLSSPSPAPSPKAWPTPWPLSDPFSLPLEMPLPSSPLELAPLPSPKTTPKSNPWPLESPTGPQIKPKTVKRPGARPTRTTRPGVGELDLPSIGIDSITAPEPELATDPCSAKERKKREKARTQCWVVLTKERIMPSDDQPIKWRKIKCQ